MDFHFSPFISPYVSSFVLLFQTSVSGDSLSLFSGNAVDPLVAFYTVDDMSWRDSLLQSHTVYIYSPLYGSALLVKSSNGFRTSTVCL